MTCLCILVSVRMSLHPEIKTLALARALAVTVNGGWNRARSRKRTIVFRWLARPMRIGERLARANHALDRDHCLVPGVPGRCHLHQSIRRREGCLIAPLAVTLPSWQANEGQ